MVQERKKLPAASHASAPSCGAIGCSTVTCLRGHAADQRNILLHPVDLARSMGGGRYKNERHAPDSVGSCCGFIARKVAANLQPAAAVEASRFLSLSGSVAGDSHQPSLTCWPPRYPTAAAPENGPSSAGSGAAPSAAVAAAALAPGCPSSASNVTSQLSALYTTPACSRRIAWSRAQSVQNKESLWRVTPGRSDQPALPPSHFHNLQREQRQPLT